MLKIKCVIDMIEGTMSFGDKSDAIIFITGLMEQFDISTDELEY